jgi:hypothetical protein
MDNLRQVKNVLYQLKKDYPSSIRLRNIVESNVDRKTGKVFKTYHTISVMRAILLPTHLKPSFVYDLSFIAANKNFTYGGFFGADTRVVIIDGADVPKEFEIKESTQVLIDTVVYLVKSAEAIVNGLGYLITMTTLTNSENSNEF